MTTIESNLGNDRIEPCFGHRCDSKQNTRVGAEGGAKSGALDADLAELIDAWPTLSDHIKAAILALVECHQGAGLAE